MQDADPVTSAALDAVGGCTRALARAAGTHQPSAVEAGLQIDAPTQPATIGGLRAFGDRIAVRQRFQNPRVHDAARPSDGVAADIYEALTLARLDALGVQWLPGIAANLLAHPGADDGGVRWLAFGVFSGRETPTVKQAAAGRVRALLSSADAAALRDLAVLLADEREFVERAAAWSTRMAKPLHRVISSDTPAALPFSLRKTSNDIRRGRYARPGGGRHDEGDARRDDLGASSNPVGEPQNPLRGPHEYHAYSTAFDRVVTAATLASREELAQLRQALEADIAATRAVVARLAKRLMRVLMARQAREWRFDLDDGLLDASRLAPFVASRGATRPFKQEFDSPFPSTAVTLLIDHSGSMRGRPMQIAAMTVEIFARVLERCGVRCEVLGFTTRDWDGGEPARLWASAGYPDNPGRLNALEHIVIKAAEVPWRRARIGLGLFLHDEMLKENIDGEALAWAHARLLARHERRRILVVVSDGTPMDEATFAANGYDYLDNHLVSVVDGIESRSPVQLAAIGIGHDVSRFYRNATRIAKIDDLGTALSNKLIALLG